MNGLGLLFLATSHISVAAYRLLKPGAWKGQDVVANLPLFLHQLAYCSCTATQFLITIERMIIGWKPSNQNYALEVQSQTTSSSPFQVCFAFPCAMLLQDGPIVNGFKLFTASEMSQKTSLVFMAGLNTTALVVVRHQVRFQLKYLFKNNFYVFVLLNFQLKEVIALTRVLIPICCSSLFFKFAVLVLAYIAFGNLQILDFHFTIIRFCCTASAMVEPLLLLTRHSLLQNRIRQIFGLSSIEVIKMDVRDSITVSNAYFNSFKQEMDRRRI
ncbi:hypothetical protein PMAYCL1PPCAC_31376, partial [Pristionchus mayeri]